MSSQFNRAEIESELNEQINALKRVKQGRIDALRPSEWRCGVLGHGVHNTLAQIARRVCGAWAWIVRNEGRPPAEFQGWVRHPVTLSKRDGKPIHPYCHEPQHRLDAFVEWVTKLEGVSGKPAKSDRGECWLWAVQQLNLWLQRKTSTTPTHMTPLQTHAAKVEEWNTAFEKKRYAYVKSYATDVTDQPYFRTFDQRRVEMGKLDAEGRTKLNEDMQHYEDELRVWNEANPQPYPFDSPLRIAAELKNPTLDNIEKESYGIEAHRKKSARPL